METVGTRAPSTASSPSRPGASLWVLRVVLTVHLGGVLVQPLLAGLFLGGDVDAIAVHRWVGLAVVLFGFAVVAVALGHAVAVRGRWVLLPVTVVLLLAETVQLGMGFARLLQVHVPLGVAITVTATVLTGWAWSPSARRAR